ncbi:MAG: sigma-70 family RNA polymerase sigma factor [Ruminococcaceae bacterium]|nr:sigma-70 family RNA polymerase sigma factor [Oscillospiraceae bacterium]
MTDNYIVDLFFARDELAISSLDDKYGRALRSFGTRMLNDSFTADECLDDTYMKTWETVPPNEPRSYLFEYVSKILRHRCLDRLRHAKRDVRNSSVTVISTELTDALPSREVPDGELLKNELTRLIADFVRKLSAESRSIFVMRYFYMDDIRTIAKRLAISEGKTKTVLKRTRDKLRIYLEAFGYRA